MDIKTGPNSIQSDAVIIRNSITDPNAFEDIFHRHYKTIYNYFSRRVENEVIEELASSVFVKAFEIRNKFDTTKENSLPWLYGISSNILNTSRRTKNRYQVREKRAFEFYKQDAISNDQSLLIEDKKLNESISGALENLKKADLEVVLLFIWEQLTYQEIASTLEIPIGTVKSRINRAKNILEKNLSINLLEDSSL